MTRPSADAARWVSDACFWPGDSSGGVRDFINGVRNPMFGLWNLKFGVWNLKLGADDLITASSWRGHGFAGVSGVSGELVPVRLKKTLRAVTFSAAPGAEAPALYWV
jgi:hypothetical protein